MLSKSNQAVLLAWEKGYRVRDDGRVVSPRGRILAERWFGSERYLAIGLKVKGKLVNAPVHRLAAYQRFGKAVFSAGQEVRHVDNDRRNNSISNIRLGDHSSNMMDLPPEVRRKKALVAASFRRSLSDSEVVQLREDRLKGANYVVLMERYGIAKSTVSGIVNRKTYTDQ